MAELPRLSNTEIIGGAAALGGIAALGATVAIVRHRRKSKKRKKNKNRNVRKRVYRDHIKKHGRRKPRTAGKRRDTSHRRIRYTSKGQPYIIGAHGKTRFISKRSAKLSYNRKGGKY